MKSLIKKHSNLSLIIITLFCIVFFNFFKGWGKSHPFSHDSNQYYSYLVAIGIHGDLDFKFPNNYWLHKSPSGKLVQKMSVGVAIMEAPFFIIGHQIAKIFNYKTDGYSAPYSYSIAFGIILYVLIGLNWLRLSLLRFFSEYVTTITLIAVFLGTNLFYYTVSYGTMSHPFLFMLLSGIIYFTIKWHENYKNKYLWLGLFACGLATAIRPTQGLMLLIPILYGVTNWSSFRRKFELICSLKFKLIFAALIFLLPVFPQLLYWKLYAGSWLYFSYHDEGFFFSDPKILEMFFSFRKGWLIYTPIMIIAIIGMLFLRTKQMIFGFWTLTILGIYLMSSWWCWWYGGSYGMRAMIDFYPLFAFGLAGVAKRFEKSLKGKLLSIITLLIFVTHSLVETIQYKRTLIHWDSMTKEAYFFKKLKLHFSPEERAEFNSLLCQPDSERAKLGERSSSICQNKNVEDENTSEPISKAHPTKIIKFKEAMNSCENCKSGSAILTKSNPYAPEYKLSIEKTEDLIKANQKIYVESKILNLDENSKSFIVYELQREKNKIEYQFHELTNKNNKSWVNFNCVFELKNDLMLKDIIKVYIYTNGEKMMVDFFNVYFEK